MNKADFINAVIDDAAALLAEPTQAERDSLTDDIDEHLKELDGYQYPE